jgi:hypothetical protein
MPHLPNVAPYSPGGYVTVSTAEILIAQYGPLLTLPQLAKILDRSAEGLRINLRSSHPWAQRVDATRLRLGRRVYFRTSDVAAILNGGDVQ